MPQIDQIIRSSRKTIAIIVRRDGKVIVRAPHRATKAQVMEFVQAKSSWIESKIAEVQKRKDQAQPKQFTAGETFLYLGDAYPLELDPAARRTALALTGGRFKLAQSAAPRAVEVFTSWYRAQARQVIAQRVQVLAAHYGLQYSQVKITSARTRWGSCSTRGTLSFTWRLVMAPLVVIDYVVVHELAHLVEKNHSDRFWAQVAAMMPDYREKVLWLKQNGHRLNLF